MRYFRIRRVSIKSLNISVMDDSFFKWVLFEWIRDRKKEQAHAKTIRFNENADRKVDFLIFQRLSPVLSLRALDHEFTQFKKGSSMKRLFIKTSRRLNYGSLRKFFKNQMK
jgi:hypothetical protein